MFMCEHKFIAPLHKYQEKLLLDHTVRVRLVL